MGRTYNVTSATSGETTESNGNAYNGGGPGSWRYGDGGGDSGGDGGGATHIAKVSGVLKNLSSHATNGNILIVAGGGGGGMQYGSSGNYVNWTGYGGHGGGINGNAPNNVNTVAYCIPTGATQSSPGSYNIGKTTSGGNETSGCGSIGSAVGGFGYGGGTPGGNTNGYWAGGGGGYYGSYGSIHSAAGGGSGYIGSSNLISGGGITKHMTCYSCTTSTAAATRTNSNTNAATATATADRAKTGNGYARITWLGDTI